MAGGELAPLLKETRRQARNMMPGTQINLPVALTRPTRREIHVIISLLSPPAGYEYQHWSQGQPPHRQLSISLVPAAPVVVADAAGPVPVADADAQVVVADAAVLPAARPKGRPRRRPAAAFAPAGPGPSPVYGSAAHFAQNRQAGVAAASAAARQVRRRPAAAPEDAAPDDAAPAAPDDAAPAAAGPAAPDDAAPAAAARVAYYGWSQNLQRTMWVEPDAPVRDVPDVPVRNVRRRVHAGTARAGVDFS